MSAYTFTDFIRKTLRELDEPPPPRDQSRFDIIDAIEVARRSKETITCAGDLLAVVRKYYRPFSLADQTTKMTDNLWAAYESEAKKVACRLAVDNSRRRKLFD